MAAPSILVVDDQPINVQLLKRKLEREGIRITAAYTGLEALEFVQKEKPDLILLDANPLTDIGNVAKSAGVMVRGRWLPKAEIDRRLEEIARK